MAYGGTSLIKRYFDTNEAFVRENMPLDFKLGTIPFLVNDLESHFGPNPQKKVGSKPQKNT